MGRPLGTSPFIDHSDDELVQLTRDGNDDAYAELWRRHVRGAHTVARSISSDLDPDDIVAEAFTKIYVIIRRGGGPRSGFRPYLFTTVRNTASSWGRLQNESSFEEIDDIGSPMTSEDEVLQSEEHNLSARAFRSLPTRWQRALWYSTVEGMSTAEISKILGIKPTAVAMLTFRAREALRQAWIQAHIREGSLDPDCTWVIKRLGAFVRSALTPRDASRLQLHLEKCKTCPSVASEAKTVGSQLAVIALIVVSASVVRLAPDAHELGSIAMGFADHGIANFTVGMARALSLIRSTPVLHSELATLAALV